MTPEEREILHLVGAELLTEFTQEVSIAMLCGGIFMPMSILFLYSLIKNNEVQPSRFWTTMGIVILGLLTTLTRVISVGLGSFFSMKFFDISDTPLSERGLQIDIKYLNVLAVLDIWMLMLGPAMSDIFIIWRAWAIFERRRPILYCLILLCICYIGVSLALSAYDSFLETITRAVSDRELLASNTLATTTTWMSFTINLLASSFIGWVLWKHIRFLRANLQERYRQFRTWKILVPLVESGAPYSLLQLAVAIIQVAPRTSAWTIYTANVIMNIYAYISLVYPSVTILLIKGPFSIVDIHNSVMSFHASQELQAI